MVKLTAAIISLGSKSSIMVEKAMKKYFAVVDHINIKEIEVNLGSNEPKILYKGEELKSYDCILAKGSFRYAPLLRAITTMLFDQSYMPIKASAFTVGHDKGLTHLKLQSARIPMPKTYITSSPIAAKEILGKINYPIIMKFPHGTQGKGVMVADSHGSASSMMDALAALNQPFLIQEYVETGGVDIRAFVVGNKVVAAMKRKAIQGESRANIHAGGKGEACELDVNTKKLAVETAKVIGVDICGVDILQSVKGPMVIEVNISPGLQGITVATKIDIADQIAKYLYDKTAELKNAGKQMSANDLLKQLGIESAGKEFITGLDFRGARILLPELVTKLTGFTDKDQVSIEAKPKKLIISKFDVG